MNLIKKSALVVLMSAMFSASVFAACSADIDMGGKKITNLGAPTANTDAVNMAYVLGDSAWTDVELSGSFSGLVKFRKVAPGFTCVALVAVQATSAYTADTNMLPVGGLPLSNFTWQELVPATSGGGQAWVTVNFDGSLVARTLDHNMEVGLVYYGNFCYSSVL